MDMLSMTTNRMRLELHHPEDGFYRGTRFDRSGVFDSLLFDGMELCGRWFPRYDPYLHDTVCGPAEEFSPVFLTPGQAGGNGSDMQVEEGDMKGTSLCRDGKGTAGGIGAVTSAGPERTALVVKVGVGLLALDADPYDRFKLYNIVDPGEWTVEATPESVLFRHKLAGYYVYEKEIAITGEAAFMIRHSLSTQIPMKGEVYNHNFFTLGRLETTPDRQIRFPFQPEGIWRAQYDSVHFTKDGIGFTRKLQEGESIFTGNIHEVGREGMPYDMTIRELSAGAGQTMPGATDAEPKGKAIAVHITGNVPVTHTVLWANHRIACLEPYNALDVGPGETFRWAVGYAVEHK